MAEESQHLCPVFFRRSYSSSQAKCYKGSSSMQIIQQWLGDSWRCALWIFEFQAPSKPLSTLSLQHDADRVELAKFLTDVESLKTHWRASNPPSTHLHGLFRTLSKFQTSKLCPTWYIIHKFSRGKSADINPYGMVRIRMQPGGSIFSRTVWSWLPYMSLWNSSQGFQSQEAFLCHSTRTFVNTLYIWVDARRFRKP